MDAALWIGPVIVAAIISSLVTVAGWIVAHQREIRAEAAQRRDKVRDVQTASLAEIVSNQTHFARADLTQHAADMETRIRGEAGYTPFVPRDASTIVFDVLLPEIDILPSQIVGSVVAYYKKAKILALFIEDLKSEEYRELSVERKIAVYNDYLGMIKSALAQAEEARREIVESLQNAYQ